MLNKVMVSLILPLSLHTLQYQVEILRSHPNAKCTLKKYSMIDFLTPYNGHHNFNIFLMLSHKKNLIAWKKINGKEYMETL